MEGKAKMTHTILAPLMGMMIVLPLLGCDRRESLTLSAESLEAQGVSANRNMNAYPMHKTVCNPWSGGVVDSSENGIKARLAHRGVAHPIWTLSSDYLSKGQASNRTLFFTDLNVPTRNFDQGFSTQTTSVVRDDMGEKLIEYFGLQFQTQLRLHTEDSAGQYELAILSDDGTTLKISSPSAEGGESVSETLINNEGAHPTRMGCAARPVTLNHKQGLDLDLSYYQGPRMHIAMMLMWRPVSTSAEPLCGASGNNLFFNPDDQSKPQSAYRDLVSRGWKPIPARNFFLPGQEVFNPCVEGEDLELSNFVLNEASSFQIDVQWQSSRPATSQILVQRISTGEEFLTDSDQMLRLQHRLVIDGLESGETYEIQAVSVAEDGAKALSAKLQVTTP